MRNVIGWSLIGLLGGWLIGAFYVSTLPYYPYYYLNSVTGQIMAFGLLGGCIGLFIGNIQYKKDKDKQLIAKRQYQFKCRKMEIDKLLANATNVPMLEREFTNALEVINKQISTYKYTSGSFEDEDSTIIVNESNALIRHLNNRLNQIVNDTYNFAVNSFIREEINLFTAMKIVSNLCTIPQAYKAVNYSINKMDLFNCQHFETSVLQTNNIIDTIKQIKLEVTLEKTFQEFHQIRTLINQIQNGESFSPENTFNIISFADKEIDFIKSVKKCLLYYALKEPYDAPSFEIISKGYLHYFTRMTIMNGKKTLIPSTDYIIAQSYIFSKGQVVDNINPLLKVWFTYYNTNETLDQYSLLSSFFMFLRARKQEEMVLEALFTNNLSRSPEQEARLVFLKQKTADVPTIINPSIDTSIFAYDYRSLNWNANEIRGYFNALTMNQEICTIPMITNEWQKTIMKNMCHWNVEEAFKILSSKIIEEFTSRMECSIVNAGPITDAGIDAALSILIQLPDNYYWVSLLIDGAQIAKSSVNINIFTVYNPQKLSSKEANITETNTNLCNKLLVLKEGQNPKLKNILDSLQNVILKTLEDWLNDSVCDSDIYA